MPASPPAPPGPEATHRWPRPVAAALFIVLSAAVVLIAWAGFTAVGEPTDTSPAPTQGAAAAAAPLVAAAVEQEVLDDAPTTTAAPAPTTASTTEADASPATTVAPAAPVVTEPARSWLVIHGVGDVALDPDYIPTFRRTGYDHAWSGLGGLFAADDLTVINLECSPSPLGEPLPKAFNFQCDPEALRPARAAGIEVANLANNHGMDFGRAALVDGIGRVRSAGIAPVGAGVDYAAAHTPALFEIGGWQIAVLGFGGVIPAASWLATDDRAGIASGDDTEGMVAAVQAAAEIADLVVVTVHWGFELETAPNADDAARGRALVEAGADVIFGHHQHRLNPLGWHSGRPIFWGLGNFVWPRLSTPSATTAVGRVVISPQGAIEACLIPAFIESSGHPVLTGEPPCGIPDEMTPTPE